MDDNNINTGTILRILQKNKIPLIGIYSRDTIPKNIGDGL